MRVLKAILRVPLVLLRVAWREVVVLGAIAVLLLYGMGWLRAENYRYAGRAGGETAVVQAPAPVVAPPTVSAAGLADGYEILEAADLAFDAPVGLLYGVWKVESSLLDGGWRTTGEWVPMRTIIEPASRCRARRGDRCDADWQAMVAICAQRRVGQPICDPNEVWSSWAGAVGPMQQMPAELIERVTGPTGLVAWQWTDRAVDFDRDETIDPHMLADAVGMAAKQLHRYYARLGDWGLAAGRYFGSQTQGYYEGRWRTVDGERRFRHGVYGHWQAWCAARGCESGMLAMTP